MKHIYAFVLAIAAIGLAACNPNGPEWKEQYQEGKYYVVKLNPLAAAYHHNVMLVPDSKGNFRMRDLSQGGTCKEFIIGHDPFIRVDTVQNWYLVDWKWGLLLSYSHSVLPMRWVDVRQPDAVYVASDFTSVASGVISTIGVVKRSDIDQYLYITPAPATDEPGSWGRNSGGISTDHLAPVYLNRYYSTQDIPNVIDKNGNWQYTKQDFLTERKRQDSLQNVYKERLAELIYAGVGSLVIKNP